MKKKQKISPVGQAMDRDVQDREAMTRENMSLGARDGPDDEEGA